VLVSTGPAAVIAGAGMAGIHLNAGAALLLLVTFVLGGVAWAAAGTAITALVPTAGIPSAPGTPATRPADPPGEPSWRQRSQVPAEAFPAEDHVEDAAPGP
jgi:hypothetical protein